MDKRLFKTREDIYKKCPSIFWEVSVFFVIAAVALIALDAVVSGLAIIIIGFLLFPLLYSVYMTLYTIKFGGTVTLKSTFAISRAYFARNSFGCFRILRCLLHAFLAEIIATAVLYLVLQNIFTGVYGSVFTDSIQELIEIYTNGDADALITFLETENCAVYYLNSVSSYSFSIGIIAFVFGIAFNSTNVYLCANISNAPANYSTSVFNRFLKKNVNSYRKDFWCLNWPLFALLILGIACGYIMVIVLDIEFKYALPISTMFGFVLLIPFAPFFFAGMEALFAKYNEEMRKASMDLTQGFLRNLKDNVNLSDEDKAKIEELLSKENQIDAESNPEKNENDGEEK